MTLQEVKELAVKGEGLQIEFKKKAAYPEKIVREVIALANTQGGTLLIGVDDDAPGRGGGRARAFFNCIIHPRAGNWEQHQHCEGTHPFSRKEALKVDGADVALIMFQLELQVPGVGGEFPT